MNVFPPNWKPDGNEAFIAGHECARVCFIRGFPPDETDALEWQMWMQDERSKMAFARGWKLFEATQRLRTRPRPDDDAPKAA